MVRVCAFPIGEIMSVSKKCIHGHEPVIADPICSLCEEEEIEKFMSDKAEVRVDSTLQ